jgi:hypothetical protein
VEYREGHPATSERKVKSCALGRQRDAASNCNVRSKTSPRARHTPYHRVQISLIRSHSVISEMAAEMCGLLSDFSYLSGRFEVTRSNKMKFSPSKTRSRSAIKTSPSQKVNLTREFAHVLSFFIMSVADTHHLTCRLLSLILSMKFMWSPAASAGCPRFEFVFHVGRAPRQCNILRSNRGVPRGCPMFDPLI